MNRDWESMWVALDDQSKSRHRLEYNQARTRVASYTKGRMPIVVGGLLDEVLTQ